MISRWTGATIPGCAEIQSEEGELEPVQKDYQLIKDQMDSKYI
jgi:hypothetical protein